MSIFPISLLAPDYLSLQSFPDKTNKHFSLLSFQNALHCSYVSGAPDKHRPERILEPHRPLRQFTVSFLEP